MAQVPYAPVPQPAQDVGTPKVSVNAPVDAFGGAIAEALGGLGKTIEHSGHELFQRAVALQDMENETEARNADADYMIKASEMRANFLTKQGTDANPQAMNSHIRELNQLRMDIRGKLSNDDSRRKFDANALGFMGRTIISAAEHSAKMVKDSYVKSAAANLEITRQTITADDSDESFERKRRKILERVDEIAGAGGYTKDRRDELAFEEISKAWSWRIETIARSGDPERAQKMLEEAQTDGRLKEDDFRRVDNIVTSQMRSSGEAKIVRDVTSSLEENVESKMSPEEAGKKAEAIAKQQRRNDILYQQGARRKAEAEVARHNHVIDQQKSGNREVISRSINDLMKTNDPPRKPEDIYERVPEARNAMDWAEKHDPAWYGKLQGQLNNLNNARDADLRRAIGEERRARQAQERADREDLHFRQGEKVMELKGMAVSTNPDAIVEFLNTDLSELVKKREITFEQWGPLFTLQNQIRAKPQGDPRVGRAARMMLGKFGQEMEDLGIDRRTEKTKDNYDRFSGALGEAIQAWTETHKKPPSDVEILEKIGPQVIKQSQTERMRRFLGVPFLPIPFTKTTDKGEPIYKQPIDPVERMRLENSIEWNSLPPDMRTEENAQRLYMRGVFRKEFGTDKEQGKVTPNKTPVGTKVQP